MTQKESRDKYYKNNPWMRSFFKAKERCEDKSCNKYPLYGGKGIKFRLTKEQMKMLWVRDLADLMEKPSIDRKESDKDYCFENCQFIEQRINSAKRVYGLRWKRNRDVVKC